MITSASFTLTLESSGYVVDGSFSKGGKIFGIRPNFSNGDRQKRSAENQVEHDLFIVSENGWFYLICNIVICIIGLNLSQVHNIL